MKVSTFLMTLVAGAFASTSAWAVPVTWVVNYENVLGSVAVTGSFVYDADSNMFGDINVSATDSIGFSNTTYSFAPDSLLQSASQWTFSNGAGPNLTGVKSALFDINQDLLTNAGGTLTDNFSIQVRTCNNATCSSSASIGVGEPYTGTLVGTPSEVPLPAAFPLVISGLAGLGFVTRKRKKTT